MDFWRTKIIPFISRYNVKSEASLYLSPNNVSISLNSNLYLSSFATNLHTSLLAQINLYSA